jgi:predicted MFS family arabinose efflux permease
MSLSNKKLHSFIIPLMGTAGGIIIANIYYNQPILKDIGDSIQVSETAIGKIAMLTQLGFGLGLFFLLPLGDKVNRKNLILSLTTALAVALVLFASITNLTQAYILSFFIGLCSTPAQIILPMAATLDKANRGKTVGRVFAGILCGILGARVLSGFITDWLSWRYVYWVSAGLVLLVVATLKVFLPDVPSKFKGNYVGLLKSTLALIGEFRILRQAALLGGLTFGIFCSFWTTLTFHLAAAPLHYSASAIGSFGLVAIGGALVAPYFGKLADKGNPFQSLLITVGLIIVSIAVMKIFPYSLPVLVGAIFFLDIGVQATQITNFARIYSLHEDAHSRLNTIYMTTYFIGAAIGTYFGLLSWKYGGWELSTWQMLIWGLGALAVVMLSEKSNKKRRKAQENEELVTLSE